MDSATEGSASASDIIDIRRELDGFSLLQDIRTGLSPADGGEKTLPTLLLYDEKGLKLFEDITYLDEYYLTNAEIEVIERNAKEIAKRIQPGSIIVELGSGNLRKVNILLQELEKQAKDVDYYALDVSLAELRRTLADVPSNTYKHVKCHGLHGTYDDGLEWMKTPEIAAKPKTVLWLGSSIGNFKRHEAAPFLSNVVGSLQVGDSMLVGIDACKDPDKVYHAYNDKQGVTHRFILNGLKQANKLLGKEAFKDGDWEVVGEFDQKAGRHQAFVTPIKDVIIEGVPIKSGERVRIEESYKYSAEETARLWEEVKLAEGAIWASKPGEYALHMVSKPKVVYPLRPEEYAANPVPSLSDWSQLWAAWDAVTREMIPEEELLDKPIKLRNACIFYLGHIPTFLDIHLTRATNGVATEPANYPQIFERGIDPDVDDPESCHSHSEIPDSWPPAGEIVQFQADVRSRVQSLYENGAATSNRRVGRALWLGYEHEIMHLETLLYMLVQSDRTLAPPCTIKPDFSALSMLAERNVAENEWFTIPATDYVEGMDDPENDEGPDRYFGWDNEKPSRKVSVRSFEAKARAITNGEYLEYLAKTASTKWPASWCEVPESANGTTKGDQNGASHSVSNGAVNGGLGAGLAVRTVFEAVPLKYALHWPVMASYDELVGCARWMGGRVPTMEEARSIYIYAEHIKTKDVQKANQRTIPAVNGHLVNDGVEESPPHQPSRSGLSDAELGPDPQELFVNLEGANVGFKHWHPVAVTQNGGRLSGQGDMGGAWEWTSTVLDKHEGFEAMGLYPAYTADFFDNKHNVVLGGSWATHPRIAGRKTFVNWYQRNYPYVWAGARLVRDL
ncbi:hypothetical protein K490DRAFT_51286 [Saccharata proteae CBS 121410]|uniref:Uncharacterized protein n=1 Tax=Saccharata proteae CBS 121410 TaxID=1314787 RepID=A0A9P4HQM0_9PEZI|nr:hypothetical protein K490DRAFT_51286 [Saccharata proteae CBS 121410]